MISVIVFADFGSAGLEPTDLLLRSALSLRRAFLRHFRIARYITINPQPSQRFSGLMAILSEAFEQLRITGDKAGVAVFAYGHFVYGSILVSVSSQMADERFVAALRILIAGLVADAATVG